LSTALGDILPSFPGAFRSRFRTVLHDRNIAVRTGARVTHVQGGGVTVDGMRRIEAAELALGFTVNRLVRHDAILRKSRLQPGDAL